MLSIRDAADVKRCQELLSGMMEAEPGRTYEFSADWVRKASWKVVPVEDTCHFAPVEIATIVQALKAAGYHACFAIASESVDPAPSCYRLAISEEELRAFNEKCGPFRYVLTDENRSWAVSCNEWYNLFAGKQNLVEALLGESIDQARTEFLKFVLLMAKGDPNEPLKRVAERYAAL